MSASTTISAIATIPSAGTLTTVPAIAAPAAAYGCRIDDGFGCVYQNAVTACSTTTTTTAATSGSAIKTGFAVFSVAADA